MPAILLAARFVQALTPIVINETELATIIDNVGPCLPLPLETSSNLPPIALVGTEVCPRPRTGERHVDNDYATQWLWTYNNDRPNMGVGGIAPAQKLKMAA
jgi:hypothetical protein